MNNEKNNARSESNKRSQRSSYSIEQEIAQNKDIYAVAQLLGMKVARDGSAEWCGHHTFWLDRRKNRFQWYGQGLWGDPVTLVSVIMYGARSLEDYRKYFRKSIAYLANIEIPIFEATKLTKRVPFSYQMKEQSDFQAARDYLHNERWLSDETIDFSELRDCLLCQNGETNALMVINSQNLFWFLSIVTKMDELLVAAYKD